MSSIFTEMVQEFPGLKNPEFCFDHSLTIANVLYHRLTKAGHNAQIIMVEGYTGPSKAKFSTHAHWRHFVVVIVGAKASQTPPGLCIDIAARQFDHKVTIPRIDAFSVYMKDWATWTEHEAFTFDPTDLLAAAR
jgi:hypothetical protein